MLNDSVQRERRVGAALAPLETAREPAPTPIKHPIQHSLFLVPCSLLLCSLVLFLMAGPAKADRPAYRPLNLERLVRRSPLVVLARKAKPFQQRITVAMRLPGKGGALRPQRVALRVMRYHVERVLQDRGGKAGKLATRGAAPITVERAFARRLLLQARLHARGVRESPLLARYGAATRGNVPAGDRAILFLQPRPRSRGYALVVNGAFEMPGALQRVQRAIRAAARPAR